MILATDLDGTLLGGRQTDRLILYNMLRDHEDIRLLFVTGRGLENVMPLLSNPLIPSPEFIICDIGATILDGKTLEPIQPIQSDIENKWPGMLAISRKLKRLRGLRLQPIAQQRRCSFYYDKTTNLTVVKRIVEEMGLDMLLSCGQFLDVLPKNVNKGSTLTQLSNLMCFPSERILVAGDTFNDKSLYDTGFKGVVVGEAEQALLDHTLHMSHVLHAKAMGAGGILESMQHFPEFQSYYKKSMRVLRQRIEGESQLLVMYHRLPYELREENGISKRIPPKSPNGIIPSLLGLFNTGRFGSWIAWEEQTEPGKAPEASYVDEKKYPHLLSSAVSLSKKEIEIFYKRFSKEAFWPVIFSFADKVKFNHEHWEEYLRVNRIFAEKAAEEAEHGALIWIHEYNLWMVPGILRQLRPDVRIGFFHHTTFPPGDIFNIIPWRREIIGSMLHCDFIAFHIPRYVENFVDVLKSHTTIKILEQQPSADRFSTYSCALGIDKWTSLIEVEGKRIKLGALPVGLDMKNIRKLFADPEVQADIHKRKEQTDGKRIILSVERLDYVKGPLEKILAYGAFLDQHPEYHGKVELVNICTPPAEGMKIYDRIRLQVEQAVGSINGKYARMDWVPIRFFFRSMPFKEVIAYYAIADVAWITPLRDGLNLVAKEYVAIQGLTAEANGVLVVSEFAGVSVEFPYAILTNPYDLKDMVNGLARALSLDEQERKMRMQRLFELVNHYDVNHWGQSFINQLAATNPEERANDKTPLNRTPGAEIPAGVDLPENSD